ncbi:MAG: 4Fe-4S binding protein [Paraprevotella sp.]|nr:4Fe-4S binding protein [Paraprevotella sp.]
MKEMSTAHVAIDPHRCVACWKCVDKCPKKVIGRVGFLWHRHVSFKDARACIGCKRCIRTCPNGVFSELSGQSRSSREKTFGFRVQRWLPAVFVASAASGLALHIAGHGAGVEAWHCWVAIHILASALFVAGVAFHIRSRLVWYKNLCRKGIGRKNFVTFFLSFVCLAVVVSGLVLLAVEGANTPAGLWHYKAGLLLVLFSCLHIFRV